MISPPEAMIGPPLSKMRATAKFLPLGLSAILCASTQAGVIAWDLPQDYASDADVATDGALVEAVNACGSGAVSDPTVNGVSFTGDPSLLGSDASISFFFGDTGSNSYDDLLNTLDYGSPNTLQIGDGNLQIGNRYLVQVWFLDERGNYDQRAMQFGDGNGNLSEEVNDQFVIGTFIANGTSQTLTINGVNTGTPHLNAYQVRDLGTPIEGVIEWGVVSDYSDADDVRTEGILVEAVNATGAEGAASPLINGIEFSADTTLFDNDATTDFLQSDTGDLAYNQFLNSLDFGSAETLLIGNGELEYGKEYLVQAWFVDERSNTDDRAMQFGDGAGNLSGEVNDQFVTGTFIAGGSSQTFTVNGVSSGPHLTGYQVRDLSSALPQLSTAAGSTVTGSFSVALTFSEGISGLGVNDFAITNGTVSNLSGNATSWSFEVTPTQNGDVEVTLPVDAVVDGDGHGNAVSNTLLTTYVEPGSEQPVPTLSTSADEVSGDYNVQVTFNEPVTGLASSDFIIQGGTAANLTGSGASYTLTVSPNFGGEVSVSLPRNTVTDLDGDNLQNLDSNSLVSSYFVEVTVSSLEALLPYLEQDNVCATLAPGVYTIDADDVRNTYGTPRFEFWGSNSKYDFTGVTIRFAADIYDDNLSMNHMQIYGNDNVFKNLTMVDLCDKYGTAGKQGGVSLTMDGVNNRLEGFHLTVRGSYPYGYGDCFGKGATNTIKHWKHSGVLVRGESNHLLNCTLDQKSYGHCIFMQAASNPIIEGCYVEAEVVTTDDILAETSGPAFDIDFLTVWGFRLPAGFTKSTCEGGIRAYNAGNTYIDGVWYSRGTSNPTILNNTLVNTRTGVTLTHATGTKYVAGCTTIGCERGYAIGSGTIENCFSDVKHGPAFGVDYESDSGITADITILPHTGSHYNGSHHAAYITGRNHNLTFRGSVENPELDLQIDVGGDLRIESSSQEVDDRIADDILINNLTAYPLILDNDSDGNTVRSIGSISDNGSDNSFTAEPWNLTSNLTFYGTATQSSNAYDTIASLATDQNTDGNFNRGSVTHTESEPQAWWKIDLEGTYELSEIKIWDRTDASVNRLSNFDVTVYDQNEQVVWTHYQSSSPDPLLSLSPDVVGQSVVIQLRGTNALSLAEVEILGSPVIYNALENWRFAHFGTYQDSGIAADTFDADQDGLPNLLEYATGLDPNNPAQRTAIEITAPSSAEGQLAVTFPRIEDSSLIYTLYGSQTLNSDNWTVIKTIAGNGDQAVITLPSEWSPTTTSEKYFFRLEVDY